MPLPRPETAANPHVEGSSRNSAAYEAEGAVRVRARHQRVRRAARQRQLRAARRTDAVKEVELTRPAL